MRFVGRHVRDLLITITSLAQIRLLALRDHQREPDEGCLGGGLRSGNGSPKDFKTFGNRGSGSLLAGRLIVPCTAALHAPHVWTGCRSQVRGAVGSR
jgi:hypothetical protein